MNEQKQNAAALVAQGKATAVEIAKAAGVSERTLYTWRQETDFLEEVRRLRNLWRAKARGEGTADQDWRLRCLNDRHKRLRAVIDQRASDPAMADVPGGKTGLLTVTYKMMSRMDGDARISEPVPEYAVDTGMLAEMRAIEQAAAIEMGQWKSRTVHEERKTLDATPEALSLAALLTLPQLEELERRALELEAAAKPKEK